MRNIISTTEPVAARTRRIVAGTVGSAVLLLLSFVAASPAEAATYPNINPSSWYLLPGEQLSFSGSGFLANESVVIKDTAGVVASTTADGSGNLSAQNVLTIPYNWQNSQQLFSIVRSATDGAVTPNPVTLQIGALNPKIAPSSWYLLPKDNLSLTGSGFAPGETITIDGAVPSTTVTADNSGNFTTGTLLQIPFDWKNSSRTITAHGSTSGNSADPVTFTVGWFYPQLAPSAWWIGYGQSMSASVSGFPSNEPITLSVNGTQVGQAVTTDGSGNANFSFTTPTSGNSATLTAKDSADNLSTSQTIYLHS